MGVRRHLGRVPLVVHVLLVAVRGVLLVVVEDRHHVVAVDLVELREAAEEPAVELGVPPSKDWEALAEGVVEGLRREPHARRVALLDDVVVEVLEGEPLARLRVGPLFLPHLGVGPQHRLEPLSGDLRDDACDPPWVLPLALVVDVVARVELVEDQVHLPLDVVDVQHLLLHARLLVADPGLVPGADGDQELLGHAVLAHRAEVGERLLDEARLVPELVGDLGRAAKGSVEDRFHMRAAVPPECVQQVKGPPGPVHEALGGVDRVDAVGGHGQDDLGSADEGPWDLFDAPDRCDPSSTIFLKSRDGGV